MHHWSITAWVPPFAIFVWSSNYRDLHGSFFFTSTAAFLSTSKFNLIPNWSASKIGPDHSLTSWKKLTPSPMWEPLYTLGDAQSFSGLRSMLPPLGSMWRQKDYLASPMWKLLNSPPLEKERKEKEKAKRKRKHAHNRYLKVHYIQRGHGKYDVKKGVSHRWPDVKKGTPNRLGCFCMLVIGRHVKFDARASKCWPRRRKFWCCSLLFSPVWCAMWPG